MRRLAFGAVAVGCLAAAALAADVQYLTRVTAKACKHGLSPQPAGGPFSVFVFCDDAGGVNIGVINTQPGAGPGAIDIRPSREWSHWNVNDRFWQDRAWATDVTSFAWSPDLRSLYVGTSEVYGTGNLYKLDLVNRTSQVLVPKADWKTDPKAGHATEILGIDPKSGRITVQYSAGEGATPQRLEVK